MNRAIPFGQVRRLLALSLALGLVYSLAIAFIATRQQHLIYRPRTKLSMSPGHPDFRLTYEDVGIAVGDSGDRLQGWWLPATSETFIILPEEPAQVLSSPKVMLYFVGVGRNIGDYNYLARVSAFRQLGFSVLVLDYRGYGRSQGTFPSEAQLYDDARAAWQYLRQERQIPAEQIVIYGESLGGAIALELAIRQPAAAGLIMQSSFTSMADTIQQKTLSQLLPIDAMLTERFESLENITALQMPVLFLHGEADSVVPPAMSRRLYAAAPSPKQLFLIPEADHVSIYQPGEASYLRVISTFAATLP